MTVAPVSNLRYSAAPMAISEQPATPDARGADARGADATPTRLAADLAGRAGLTGRLVEIVERVNVALWQAVHPLGPHRWRDAHEVDAERGFTQYRGSRCSICDEPWEGW